MMKVMVKVADVKKAFAKVKGFIADSVVMQLLPKAVGDNGAYRMMFEVSNGTAQASVSTVYYGEGTKLKLIVSSSIIDLVDSISVFGEEITIEVLDSCLKLTCGDAVVPVNYLKEASTMDMTAVADALQFSLKSKDFANLVMYGGFASGDATMSVPLFSGTIIFTPLLVGEKCIVRSLSCCGPFVATSFAEVDVTNTDIFYKNAGVGGNKVRNVAVNYASLLALSKRLVSEDVIIYFASKQVIIRDNKDVYIFTIIEGDILSNVLSIAQDEVVKDFEYSIDRESFKKALAVIGTANSLAKTSHAARLTFDGEVLTIADKSHSSRVAVPCTVIKDNKTERMFDADFLKAVANSMPSELKVYGPKGGRGIYFEGAACKAYLLPVKEA